MDGDFFFRSIVRDKVFQELGTAKSVLNLDDGGASPVLSMCFQVKASAFDRHKSCQREIASVMNLLSLSVPFILVEDQVTLSCSFSRYQKRCSGCLVSKVCRHTHTHK